ncbi:leucine-rich repeat-containing protein 41 isoform X1 [Electrophorus electricus]|uniref:leucine-rich repeat-containing protein 41 isoform X1 n=2 Tax=Electrophorus electricus TaxID=8005 RepID=UPI0015D07D36|nr:leucine-rich repeat-containing protein 41 isoform X1 [Electrophorus electricus]
MFVFGRMASSDTSTLVQLCMQKVARHMDVLEERARDLPASLLKDLMPHLNMFYLDRIEQAAHLKGISVSSAWAAKWRELNRTWRCKLKFMPPEADWKQKCMESFFHTVLLRPTLAQDPLPKVSAYALLSVSAQYVRVLSLQTTARDVCARLASEELRPVLHVLEKSVRCVRLLDARTLLKRGRTDVLFVLHRLIDHGAVTEVVLKRAPDRAILSWITARCRGRHRIRSAPAGSCRDEALWAREGPAAAKRSRLCLLADEEMGSEFSPSCSVPGRCPEGQVQCLDVEVHTLSTVSYLLPDCTGLHSCHLYCSQPLWENEVADLLESLRKLFLRPHCCLRDLSIGNVCERGLLARVLNTCPALYSLSLEINPPQDTSCSAWNHSLQFSTKLSLEKLSLKSSESQMMVESFPAVLQHVPMLSTLHVTGVRHARVLLQMLPEFNPLLKCLTLEDMSLADCHQEIIHLLENSSLQELSLKDCRLLEKCAEKKAFLALLVAAVKGLSSLRALSLCQNRLATSVIEIADLFLGECTSKITKLDLSSNFILPADLLEFSRRMDVYRPTQRLTLDLRFNPLDRDPELKGQALGKLLPCCNVLTDGWDSRSTMADHVSVM